MQPQPNTFPSNAHRSIRPCLGHQGGVDFGRPVSFPKLLPLRHTPPYSC
ncbi:hypothetical protein BV133_645 [Blastochloris viridis]|uniref:Uncharacterized protein n=1 Tax=Blastochloris viridis TaxID=1079 RepID=A0A182CYU3_BLAVI|nr:hypothetical protein BV133_645 [Blastochloris viridis]